MGWLELLPLLRRLLPLLTRAVPMLETAIMARGSGPGTQALADLRESTAPILPRLDRLQAQLDALTESTARLAAELSRQAARNEALEARLADLSRSLRNAILFSLLSFVAVLILLAVMFYVGRFTH